MKAFKSLAGSRVLVNLTNGEALEGRVVNVGATWLDLTGTRLHNAQGRGSLDGTVVVPEGSIMWVQVVA